MSVCVCVCVYIYIYNINFKGINNVLDANMVLKTHLFIENIYIYVKRKVFVKYFVYCLCVNKQQWLKVYISKEST